MEEVFVLSYPPNEKLVFKEDVLTIGSKEYKYSEISDLEITVNLRVSREGFISIVVNDKKITVIFDALEHSRLASTISKVKGKMKNIPQKNVLSLPQAVGIIVVILLFSLCIIFPEIAAGMAVVGGVMIFVGIFMSVSNKTIAGLLFFGGIFLAFIGLALVLMGW